MLWYNHFLQEDGEPSQLDHSTLHGGCGVVRGTKWILTVWINFQFAHERKEELVGMIVRLLAVLLERNTCNP